MGRMPHPLLFFDLSHGLLPHSYLVPPHFVPDAERGRYRGVSLFMISGEQLFFLRFHIDSRQPW